MTVIVRPAPPAPLVTADLNTSVALLNCLLREVAGPAGNVRVDRDHAMVRLPQAARTLRVELARPSAAEPRPTGRVFGPADDGGWAELDWRTLVQIVSEELAGLTGVPNIALEDQVARSNAFARATLARGPADDHEQSLVAGHRFHPAPKYRSGGPGEALRYAPELGATFRLRHLGVPRSLLHERRSTAANPFPDEHARAVLPVHPWQWALLTRARRTAALLEAGVVDLGERGPLVRPTSSVRTVDTGRGFLKLSLGVLLTNCVRVNRRYEIDAAVALDAHLEPVRAEFARRFPGTTIAREPAARTVTLDGLADDLGVIARAPLPLPAGTRPALAAALAEPQPLPWLDDLLTHVTARRARLLDWWGAYLARVVPPVLSAFLEHGVVVEAHLQNVVVGLTDGFPTHTVLRDLEGMKLVAAQHGSFLAQLEPAVREHLTYSRGRGWERVAYCLLLNHVGGVLGALADRDPGADRLLWAGVRAALLAHGRDHGDGPELRALLAGAPVPAKTNLLTRWHQGADRDSGSVPVRLPLTADA